MDYLTGIEAPDGITFMFFETRKLLNYNTLYTHYILYVFYTYISYKDQPGSKGGNNFFGLNSYRLTL